MTNFLAGALTSSHLIAAVFFLRFWKKTHDGLFLQFSLAFLLFALNQIASSILELDSERVGYTYILRVLGYIVILVAIVEKNRRAARKSE